jgi:hypothetical protein
MQQNARAGKEREERKRERGEGIGVNRNDTVKLCLGMTRQYIRKTRVHSAAVAGSGPGSVRTGVGWLGRSGVTQNQFQLVRRWRCSWPKT